MGVFFVCKKWLSFLGSEQEARIWGYPLITLASEGGGGVKQIFTFANKGGQ